MEFPTHDLESAPEHSRPLLEQVTEQYGFVPNLYGILAESPPALKGLMDIADSVAKTTLTPTEQQVVYLAISYENDCSYCMTGHSGVANIIGVPDRILASLREGKPLDDPRLSLLSEFSKDVLRSKGWVEGTHVQAFLDAGFTKANVLDVILIISQKILSNYAGHITNVAVDEPFQPFKWNRR